MNAMLVHQNVGENSLAAAALIDEHIVFDESKTSVPNTDTTDIYQQSYQRYAEYVELVTPMFK